MPCIKILTVHLAEFLRFSFQIPPFRSQWN